MAPTPLRWEGSPRARRSGEEAVGGPQGKVRRRGHAAAPVGLPASGHGHFPRSIIRPPWSLTLKLA
eukprot:3886022-Alexandrium_andersonii.AAC.1